MINISISVGPDESVDAEFGKLGYVRHSLVERLLANVALPNNDTLQAMQSARTDIMERFDTVEALVDDLHADDENYGAGANLPAANEAPKRERGKPGEGRARRTKAEIAEDEAADRADAVLAAAGAPQISTGEERVGPEDAETIAQDAADEHAETEENRKGLTLDDLRTVIGTYQRTYGMAAVTADVLTLLGKKMIDVTEDELPSAVKTMQDALDNNPLGRTPVGQGATEPKQPVAEAKQPEATKADAVAALMAYAMKYDGQNTDQAKMTVTMVDGPKVLTMLFGESVTSISKIPPSPENYAKAVNGINEMLTKNPFGREVKVA